MPRPTTDASVERLTARLAAAYAAHPGVEAVVFAGSRTGGRLDEASDVDLYVYLAGELPVAERARIAEDGERVEIDNRFWETGDEWIDGATGTGVDVMFRDPRWIEGELERVLDRHEASLGYTTCLWFNVVTSRALFDRDGWFAGVQRRAARPYPEELARAIVAKNRPVLRGIHGSYLNQLKRAVARHDRVSVNHRTAALLASCFDILFALNRRPHPGEKRLLEHATAPGMTTPDGMAGAVGALLDAAAGGADVVAAADALIDGVEAMIVREVAPPRPGTEE